MLLLRGRGLLAWWNLLAKRFGFLYLFWVISFVYRLWLLVLSRKNLDVVLDLNLRLFFWWVWWLLVSICCLSFFWWRVPTGCVVSCLLRDVVFWGRFFHSSWICIETRSSCRAVLLRQRWIQIFWWSCPEIWLPLRHGRISCWWPDVVGSTDRC